MITYSTDICKRFAGEREKLTNGWEVGLYKEAVGGYREYGEQCPKCGAIGQLKPHGSYQRRMVCAEGGKPKDEVVDVKRYKCGSCGSTHALLPDVLVPYSQYSLSFKLEVLTELFKGERTVAAICESYYISASTLYAWKKLFLCHIALLLGVLAAKEAAAPKFLAGFFGTDGADGRLRGFRAKHGFSFMQSGHGATGSDPP
jgi:ribosomal protein S27AE